MPDAIQPRHILLDGNPRCKEAGAANHSPPGQGLGPGRDGASKSAALARVSVAAYAPVLGIERIDPLTAGLRREIVEDGRKGVNLFAVNNETPRHPERAIHSEDLARRAGDHLGLEPAVLGALARVKLPDQVRRHSAEVTYEDIDESRIANRAAHRRADSNAVSAVAGRYHQACPIVEPVPPLGHAGVIVWGWSLALPVAGRYLSEIRHAAGPY